MIFPVQWEILVESWTQKKNKNRWQQWRWWRDFVACWLVVSPSRKKKKRRGKWKSEKVKKWKSEKVREMRRDAERCGEMRRDAERCGETARNRRDSNRFSTGYAPSSCPDLEYYHRSSPFVFTKKKKKKMKQDKKTKQSQPPSYISRRNRNLVSVFSFQFLLSPSFVWFFLKIWLTKNLDGICRNKIHEEPARFFQENPKNPK